MATPPSGMYDALRHDADKQAWVDWLFSHIAEKYDLGNQIMSAGWHYTWKERLVDYAKIEPHHTVLDLSCGTGDVTYLVARRAREVVGCDINREMMAVGEKKRPAGVTNVRFVQGDALALPFDDASFDRVTVGYSGRGWPDIPQVCREVFRVLKPGGEFWNLDFARPPSRVVDLGYRGWMMASGAALGTVLHASPRSYMYIPASMAHYRGQRWLRDVLGEVGFVDRDLTETMLCLMAYNRGVKPMLAMPADAAPGEVTPA